MAGNGQHNPPFNYNDEDEYIRALLFDMVMPPIMGGGGSQTYQSGSAQVQHGPYLTQGTQADNSQYHGSSLAQGFPNGASLGHSNAQSPLNFSAVPPLQYGTPQLTLGFENGGGQVMYTEPNLTTVGHAPAFEDPHLDLGLLGGTTNRQPTIQPGPSYSTARLNPPQAQYVSPPV